jgi:hypothetical protein
VHYVGHYTLSFQNARYLQHKILTDVSGQSVAPILKRFGTTYRSRFQIGFSEASVRNCHCSLHNNPEEPISLLRLLRPRRTIFTGHQNRKRDVLLPSQAYPWLTSKDCGPRLLFRRDPAVAKTTRCLPPTYPPFLCLSLDACISAASTGRISMKHDFGGFYPNPSRKFRFV